MVYDGVPLVQRQGATASVLQVQQLFYRLLCLCLSSLAAHLPSDLGSGTGIAKPHTQYEVKSLKKWFPLTCIASIIAHRGIKVNETFCF